MIDYLVEEVSFYPIPTATSPKPTSQRNCPGCGNKQKNTTGGNFCFSCGTIVRDGGHIEFSYGVVEWCGQPQRLSMAEAEALFDRIEENPDILLEEEWSTVSIWLDFTNYIYDVFEGAVSRYVHYDSVGRYGG